MHSCIRIGAIQIQHRRADFDLFLFRKQVQNLRQPQQNRLTNTGRLISQPLAQLFPVQRCLSKIIDQDGSHARIDDLIQMLPVRRVMAQSLRNFNGECFTNHDRLIASRLIRTKLHTDFLQQERQQAFTTLKNDFVERSANCWIWRQGKFKQFGHFRKLISSPSEDGNHARRLRTFSHTNVFIPAGLGESRQQFGPHWREPIDPGLDHKRIAADERIHDSSAKDVPGADFR